MACCCKSGSKSKKASTSCLGRCDLYKHKCLEREDVKPGPIPKNIGWLYTAKDSPPHQLRCGWRPGHISCAVLKKIERHNCRKLAEPCSISTDHKCRPYIICNPAPSPTPSCNTNEPLIRITRHAGQYTISTKPSNMDTSPSGPHPLKYFIDNDDGGTNEETKYSIEGKFNDSQFDYTSSNSSFVIEFSPPLGSCK